jgi:uncharacterized membrane protein YraQ (UPF0718 family)
MKGALIFMVLVVAGMVVALLARGDGAFGRAMSTSASTGLKFIPILLLAIFMIGAVDELLPKAVVEKWLSDAAGIKGIGVAWIAGILTPAGSLVGLPIVAGLAKAGVSAAVLVTYLVSLATLSIVRVPMEIGLIGVRLTVIRVVACLFLPPIAGLAVRVVLPIVQR